MRFEKMVLELEKYQTLDIIAASQPTDPTQGETEPTANTDPYKADKW